MAKKAKRSKALVLDNSGTVSSALKPYNVSLTASAKAVYLEMRRRSLEAESKGNHRSAHCKTFRIVDDAIRRLIPADPTNSKFALHRPLHNFFRIAKGRLRIVWAVAPEHRELLIVFIADTLRKDGDVSDPYAILGAMQKAGFLKEMIEDWQRALTVPPDAPVH